MSSLQISTNTTIAAQQLATSRENIRTNDNLTAEAKEWHTRYLERCFADAQYGQTLSWPARVVWAVGSIPASLVWNLVHFPDILRYGVLGGHGGAVVEVEGGAERLRIEDGER